MTTLQKISRNNIEMFEKIILSIPGSKAGDSDEMPLKHTFADGIYVREIFIPKGHIIVGKIHRHKHPNFLMSGKVRIFTESEGDQVLTAPLSMISPAGTKRVVVALEDTVWITVHATDKTDPVEIEKDVIVPSYKQLEKEKKDVKKLS